MVSGVCGKAVTIKPVAVREYMRIWGRERSAPIAAAHGPNLLRWLLGREPP
ncbi:hypothetical protein OG568_54375 (plasmid) [Streptomyces sp. NBC_01450]|uniref:hypothetical protein n=1 Tax=Streptomyces sp. NBC_01450 TaxID=2903871 RepID=UPI002E348FB8|nr:hypothetical protein [Streptomyces sp. NBC_01450]